MVSKLPIEIQKLIFSYTKIECHSCKRRLTNLYDINNIYKIQGKYVFCSQECYLFC